MMTAALHAVLEVMRHGGAVTLLFVLFAGCVVHHVLSVREYDRGR